MRQVHKLIYLVFISLMAAVWFTGQCAAEPEPGDTITVAAQADQLVKFTEMISVCFRNQNAIFEHQDGYDVIRIVDGDVQVAPKDQVVNPPPGTLDPWATVTSGSGMWDFLADSLYRRLR